MTDLMLASAFDERYVTPARVMIASLVAHLPAGVRPVLHVVQRSLPQKCRSSIDELIETRYVTPADEQVAVIPAHPRLPPETAWLLLLPELLPELDRVCFLDADVLVRDDVTRLWQTDLEGRVVAAAADSAVERCSARRGVQGWQALGIPPDHSYFNAGVLVMDLRAWRERDVTARILDYMRTHPHSQDLFHQGAMNAVLWDDWLELDGRWNLLATVAGRRRSRSRHDPGATGIVHFAGRMKPWLGPIGGPFDGPYREELARLGVDRSTQGARRRALGAYDRWVRDLVYPLEHGAWSRGWIR